MKVFVATEQGQGQADDDFFHCIDGELVRIPDDICSNPRCGCDRSVVGLASSKASTTFMAVDRPDLDPGLYRSLFLDALAREGWIAPGDRPADWDETIDRHITEAEHQPERAVLRIRVERHVSEW